jgi:hypothetical protein
LNIPAVISLLVALYFSYFFVVKYPLIIANILAAKDSRIEKILSKIWLLNFSARASVIHTMMKRKRNREYFLSNHPSIIKSYEKAKRYWLISLVPVAIFMIYGQISQGHEILTDPDGFREKVDNAWYFTWLKDNFGSGK